MSASTKIQWCDSTCNPTMGCDGCELWTNTVKKCYAGTLHVRFGGSSVGYAPTFEEVSLFPGRMKEATRWSDLTGTKRKDKPWLDGYPRLIFVSDMSDSLSASVEFEYLESEIIENVVSERGQVHQWLWLTKRPERMAKFSEWLLKHNFDWPPNLWVGTSVTSQKTTSRIRHLLKVGNSQTIRFLSVEPQHEVIDLSTWLAQLDWVIQGGESGHGACPFQLEWAVSLNEACRSFGVAYFLKQLGADVRSKGEQLTYTDSHAGDWHEWPEKLRVRQLPRIKADSKNSPVATNTASQAALKAWETRRNKRISKS